MLHHNIAYVRFCPGHLSQDISTVIPAQAGIQVRFRVMGTDGSVSAMADSAGLANDHRSSLWMPTWIPAFAGMTVLRLC